MPPLAPYVWLHSGELPHDVNTQPAEPTGLVPYVQALHAVFPFPNEYVFAAHGVHVDAPDAE